MLKLATMYIKFNNIRDLADARYAAAAMAEWVGFTVGKEDSLPVGKIQEILGWCSGPKLVLEPDASVTWDMLQAYLSVLPVDGIECTELQFQTWAEQPEMQSLSIILLGENSNGSISHSAQPAAAGVAHIWNITTALSQPEKVTDQQPFGISVDCTESEELMSKNFDTWNYFFESIGVF